MTPWFRAALALRPIGLVVSLFLLTLVAGCSDTRSETASSEVLKPVRLLRVTIDPVNASHRLPGRIAPVRTLDLSFQVAGRIAEMPAATGTLIPEGEVIALLDSADFELRLQQAQARRSLAVKTAERARRMLETAGGSRAALDAADTDVTLAQAALDLARQQLAYTRIEAPFDALVTRRLQEEHANVDAFAPVIRVQDVTELRVQVDLPEALLGLVAAPRGFHVEALPQVYPGRRFELHYREHHPQANAFAQTYQVAFGMPRPETALLLPGMTVTVVVTPRPELRAERGVAPRLPLTAVDSAPSGAFRIWVYDPDTDAVSARPVTLGSTHDEQVEIASGVRPGEWVVAAGIDALRDGMRVRPLGDGLQ